MASNDTAMSLRPAHGIWASRTISPHAQNTIDSRRGMPDDFIVKGFRVSVVSVGSREAVKP